MFLGIPSHFLPTLKGSQCLAHHQLCCRHQQGWFGLVMLQTFVEAFNSQRSLCITGRETLGRQPIPVEGLILAGLYENLFNLAVKLPILAAAFFFCGMLPAATFPIGILCLTIILLLGTAFGIFVAPWVALKRDVDHGMNFLPLVLIATTPVFVETHAHSRLLELYRLNPLSWLFDVTRDFSYGACSSFDVVVLLSVLAFLTLFLPISWFIFRIARAHVVERCIQ